MLFFLAVSLYSGLLVLLSSEVYLIGGSNVIDFVYTVNMPAKITVIIGLYIFGYLSIFTKFQKYLSRLMLLLAFLLSLVASQSVVYSGKANIIKYYAYGFGVDEIGLNPTKEESVVVASVMPGIVSVSRGERSFKYVSLFCPFCLEMAEVQEI